MVNYKDWNKEIYKFYFENISSQNLHLFSVNKDNIDLIGKNLGISSGASDDFIKSVLSEIVKFKNGKYTLSLENCIKEVDSIPNQTAVIAFFILMASSMSKYMKNAYWPKIEDTIRKFYGEPNISNLKQNTDELYTKLYDDFAQRISKKYNITYTFPNPFSWKLVGIPMFQTMITEKDYCLLTQKFDLFEKNKKNIITLDNYIAKETKNDFKYSMSYRNFCQHSNAELSGKFTERILDLYTQWVNDGKIVYEYDEKDYKRKRKSISLLYGYCEKSEDVIQWFLSADYQNDYDIIEFSDKTLTKYEDSSYYKEIPISSSDISLKNFLTYSSNIKNLAIQRTKNNYIKLKKEGQIYIEKIAKNAIKEGDKFSIIGNEQFFEERWEDLEQITDGAINPDMLYKIEGTELWLLNDIDAKISDNDIVCFNPANKINFIKGLKTSNGNYTWIKDAQPLIKTQDMRYIYIREKHETNWSKEKKEVIDIREKYNSIGEYQIQLETSDYIKNFNIVPIETMSEEQPDDFFEIYKIIDKNKVYTSKENTIGLPSVFGADINNFEEYAVEKINNNSRKINKLLYIFKILENHENERKFIMPTKLKSDILTILNNQDLSTFEFANKYIENNYYIDNYIYFYLNIIRRSAI